MLNLYKNSGASALLTLARVSQKTSCLPRLPLKDNTLLPLRRVQHKMMLFMENLSSTQT